MQDSTVFSSVSQVIGQNQGLPLGAGGVPVVGRRLPDAEALGGSLITVHTSPQKVRTPIRLRSSAAKTGERVEKYIYDESGEDAYSGYVMDTSAADSAAATYTANFDGQIEIWRGAHCVKAKRPPRHRLSVNTALKRGGIRGAVRGFSKGSRRRLMMMMGKIRSKVLPSFLTITYPGHEGKNYRWMSDAREWKRHLDMFIKRMRRQFPKSGEIWKLEPQKRGAPHFHMFVWGCNHFELEAWAKQAWFEVVGSGDPKHLEHGTNCKALDSWRAIANYASKYFSKVVTPADGFDPAVWQFPGRWWGVSGEKYIPWGECVRYLVPRFESTILIRTMRKYAKIRGRDYPSLSVLVGNADYWADNLDALLYRGGV